MEVKIDFTKSASQNAEEYFERSKRARRKAEGAEKAAKDLEQKKKGVQSRKQEQRSVKRIEEKKWYEKFNWFFTSSGTLCIGGRSAQQNEQISAKHFDEGDLFFHADIFGASVVILKGGEKAAQSVKDEAAQFAASYSSAWEQGTSAVNVYALKRGQVSKSKERGSLGTGSFLLSGEREWFRSVSLELAAFLHDIELRTQNQAIQFIPATNIIVDTKRMNVAPFLTCKQLNITNFVHLKPGNMKKSDAAKLIAKRLGYNEIDYIMQHLPAGSFSVK